MNDLLRRRMGWAGLAVLALFAAAQPGAAAPARPETSAAFSALLEAVPAAQRDALTAPDAAPAVSGVLVAAQGGSDGRGGPACTPSPKLTPGSGYAPQVNDQRRFASITDLLSRIAACRPLPYAHDGIVNNNREGMLPQQPKGYYLEYTLMVDGRKTGDGPEPIDIGGRTYMSGAMLSARGPERLIIGGRERVYYTPDHYKTFIELTIVR